MTQDQLDDRPCAAFRRYVPLIAWLAVILVIVIIPFKIIGMGYLPGDDALRHAAKAVSGKSWPEILVVGDAFKIDHNLGWHLLLTEIHRWTNWNAEQLVIFSVAALFIVVGLVALPWLRRPEAWLITLIAAMVISDVPQRFMLGRPFLLTFSSVLVILFAWQKQGSSAPKWWTVAWMAGLIAICSFVHGVWYLWALPVAAFFLAGQFQWGVALGCSWIAGSFLGALLSGHPIEYLQQALELAFRSVGMHKTPRTMVPELQPFAGNILAVIMVGCLMVLRRLSGLQTFRPWSSNPAFWLACLGWILGFKVGRFWDDWGWAGLMVLTAWDLDLFLQGRLALDSLKRLGIVCGLALTAYLSVTSDLADRWTQNLTWTYLTQDNQDLDGWLPDKGGILYSGEITVFDQTFFKNPTADWKYILGFEPTFMPEEDFKVYHSILWNFGDAKAYEPWVNKMRPLDRLVIRGAGGGPPNILQLEWKYGVSGIWIGRLPRTNSAPARPVSQPGRSSGA